MAVSGGAATLSASCFLLPALRLLTATPPTSPWPDHWRRATSISYTASMSPAWSEDTISSFERVVAGEFDQLPEQAFFMAGSIDDVVENAKKLQG